MRALSPLALDELTMDKKSTAGLRATAIPRSAVAEAIEKWELGLARAKAGDFEAWWLARGSVPYTICRAVERWQRALRDVSRPAWPPEEAFCDACLVCPLSVPGTACTPEWDALCSIYRDYLAGRMSLEAATVEAVALIEGIIQRLRQLERKEQSCL